VSLSTVDRAPELRRQLRALTASRVFVGFPAGTALRRPDGDEPREVNNAFLGYVHNNGAPEANIPARPFMGPGIANAQGEIVARFNACAQSILRGGPVNIEATLHAVGLIAQNAIRAKISDGPFLPLAPATLAARRRRGRTGTQPLQDTGQMRNAVNYVIRPAAPSPRS